MDQENEDSDEAGVEGFEIVEYGGIAEEENEIAALVESDSGSGWSFTFYSFIIIFLCSVGLLRCATLYQSTIATFL